MEALVRNAASMIEIRLFVQYGDYLPESLRRRRGNDFDDMIWKQESVDWSRVAHELEREDQAHDEYYDIWRMKNAKPDLRFSACVSVAAHFIGISAGHLTWEIKAYARRQDTAHNETKELIAVCDWQRLADRIIKDLKLLEAAFPGREQEQIAMRKTIRAFQAEHFQFIGSDRAGNIVWVLNERTQKKWDTYRERVRQDLTFHEI